MYGEGVAWGKLRENPNELPKRSHRPRNCTASETAISGRKGNAHVPDVEHGPTYHQAHQHAGKPCAPSDLCTYLLGKISTRSATTVNYSRYRILLRQAV